MVKKASILCLTVVLIAQCFGVPIARQKRQANQLAIERIEDRESNDVAGIKFVMPIEDVPNRDYGIMTADPNRSDPELIPVKIVTDEVASKPKPKRSTSTVVDVKDPKYVDIVYSEPASIELNPNGELSRTRRQPEPSGAPTIPASEQKGEGLAIDEDDEEEEQHEGSGAAPNNADAEQLFVQGISDKIQEQYAAKTSQEPATTSTAPDRDSDAEEAPGAKRGKRGEEKEEEVLAELFLSKEVVEKQSAPEQTERAEQTEHEISPASAVAEVAATPSAVDEAKQQRPTEPDTTSPAPSTTETLRSRRRKPTFTPRKPAARRTSHSALRSSSEELTSLLEDHDSSMEKDLVSQSQTEKLASIVQRSPASDSSSSDGSSSSSSASSSSSSSSSSDEKKESDRSTTGSGGIGGMSSMDDIMAYLTPENISSMQSRFSSMLESLMNVLAVSNVIASMNNGQSLQNMMSRFTGPN